MTREAQIRSAFTALAIVALVTGFHSVAMAVWMVAQALLATVLAFFSFSDPPKRSLEEIVKFIGEVGRYYLTFALCMWTVKMAHERIESLENL